MRLPVEGKWQQPDVWIWGQAEEDMSQATLCNQRGVGGLSSVAASPPQDQDVQETSGVWLGGVVVSSC